MVDVNFYSDIGLEPGNTLLLPSFFFVVVVVFVLFLFCFVLFLCVCFVLFVFFVCLFLGGVALNK